MYNGFPRKKTDNEAESLTPFPPQHTIAKTERNARQWIAAAGRTAWSLIVALETEKGVGETLVPEKLVPGNQRNKRVKTSRWQPPRFYDFTTRTKDSHSRFFFCHTANEKKSRDRVFMGNQRRYLETGKVNWRSIYIVEMEGLLLYIYKAGCSCFLPGSSYPGEINSFASAARDRVILDVALYSPVDREGRRG